MSVVKSFSSWHAIELTFAWCFQVWNPVIQFSFEWNRVELLTLFKSEIFGVWGHSWVLQLEYLLEGPVQSPSWHSRDSTKTPPPQVLEQSWSEFQSPHFPELSSVSVLYTKESTPTNKINNKRQNECYVLHKNLADWFMSASFTTLNPKAKVLYSPLKP